MIKRTLFSLIILCVGVAPIVANACQCVMPDEAGAIENYEAADIVLRVKPTEFSKGWNASGPLVTFAILETYKTNQDLDGTITAKNNPLPAACGNEILPNKEYVFGFWDLQRAGFEVKNTIGYRLMHSCALHGVQHYIKNNYKNMKDK